MERGGGGEKGRFLVNNCKNKDLLISPDLFSREVNNGGDEVLPHDDGADLLPVSCALPQEQTNGLQRQLHCSRRVGHGAHLHQVLLLNGLNSYQHQVSKDEDL